MVKELVYSTTKKDFNIDWFNGTGPGGQNRNKVKACCRITHLPTGLTAVGQRERTRERNFKDAFGRLSKKIVATVLNDDVKTRGTNEEVIRTYHQPDNRVKDMASGFTQSYKEVIDKNDISKMLDARARCLVEKITNE